MVWFRVSVTFYIGYWVHPYMPKTVAFVYMRMYQREMLLNMIIYISPHNVYTYTNYIIIFFFVYIFFFSR